MLGWMPAAAAVVKQLQAWKLSTSVHRCAVLCVTVTALASNQDDMSRVYTAKQKHFIKLVYL